MALSRTSLLTVLGLILATSNGVLADDHIGSDGQYKAANHTALVAHAVCGGLATMVFFTLGTLVPRLARGISLHRWWFPVHGVLNGVIGGILVIIAYGIAKAFLDGSDSGSDGHHALGAILFFGVLVQIALGIIVHWINLPWKIFKTQSGRGLTNFLHMIIGVLVLIVGWAATWTGMDAEWPQYSGTGGMPEGWKIAFGIIIAVTAVIYIIGLIFFLPRQRRMERQARLAKDASVAHGTVDGAGVELTPAPRMPRGWGWNRQAEDDWK